jgi:hypothetical protein
MCANLNNENGVRVLRMNFAGMMRACLRRVLNPTRAQLLQEPHQTNRAKKNVL